MTAVYGAAFAVSTSTPLALILCDVIGAMCRIAEPRRLFFCEFNVCAKLDTLLSTWGIVCCKRVERLCFFYSGFELSLRFLLCSIVVCDYIWFTVMFH